MELVVNPAGAQRLQQIAPHILRELARVNGYLDKRGHGSGLLTTAQATRMRAAQTRPDCGSSPTRPARETFFLQTPYDGLTTPLAPRGLLERNS